MRWRAAGGRTGRAAVTGGAGGRVLSRAAAGSGALVLAVVLVGCSGGEEPAAPAPTGAPSPSVSPSAAGTGTAPTPSGGSSGPSDPGSTGGPEPTRPASTAGSLGQGSLPAPAVLGPGWAYYVDGGDVEGNYIGNGTPSVSRDPGELVSTLVPPGCAVESVYDVALPRPAYALEVDYAHPAGVQGVGLGLEFATPRTAQQFVASYAAALEDCTPASGAPDGTTVVTVLDAPTGAAALTRIEDPLEGTVWSELVVRRGAVVTLLGVDTATGAALPRWPAVAASL